MVMPLNEAHKILTDLALTPTLDAAQWPRAHE